jgi:hypothetical protein
MSWAMEGKTRAKQEKILRVIPPYQLPMVIERFNLRNLERLNWNIRTATARQNLALVHPTQAVGRLNRRMPLAVDL